MARTAIIWVLAVVGLVDSAASCPYVVNGGSLSNDATRCVCQLAGNCPGCDCEDGCGAGRMGGPVTVNPHTVSFINNAESVQGCSNFSDLITVPKSYYMDVQDLQNKCPSDVSGVLKSLLVDGFNTYAAGAGSTEVWQCLRHDITTTSKPSISWLHIHTFCSSGRTSSLPSAEGYCVKMSAVSEAHEIAKKIVNDARIATSKPNPNTSIQDLSFMQPVHEEPWPMIHDLAKNPRCVLHSLEAVDEALDAAIFTWAAVKRCGHSGDNLQCGIDVASATESAIGMVTLISKAVHKCSTLQSRHPTCSLAVGDLLQSAAGLAATSGGVIEHCPNMVYKPPHPASYQYWKGGGIAHCIVDVKDSTKALLRAASRLMSIKRNCVDLSDRKSCEINVLSLVGALAALGEYIAGSVGHCSPHGDHESALCSSEVMGLLRNLAKVGKAGTVISQQCVWRSRSERLYIEDIHQQSGAQEAAYPRCFVTIMLVTFLPIAAAVSFKLGLGVAKHAVHPLASESFESVRLVESGVQ